MILEPKYYKYHKESAHITHRKQFCRKTLSPVVLLQNPCIQCVLSFTYHSNTGRNPGKVVSISCFS